MNEKVPDEMLVYQVYPRKRERISSLRAIRKALKKIAPRDVNWLIERTRQFAVEMQEREERYIPYAATWFNREGYEDGQDERPGAHSESFEGNGFLAGGEDRPDNLKSIFDATYEGIPPRRDDGLRKAFGAAARRI